MRTIAQLLHETAARAGDKPALIFRDRSFSYRELDELARRTASGLRNLGVGPGEVVSIYAGNSWEWVVSYFAAASLGAVINPINTMLTGDEVRYVANDCRSRAVLASSDKADLLKGITEDTTVEHVVLFEGGEGARDFRSLLQHPPLEQPVRADPATVGVIAYTSGTTGYPKGAMLTQWAVALNAALTANAHVRTERDTVVTSLPVAHVYGMAVMNAAFQTGGTLVLVPRFSEEEVLEAIQRYRATMFEGVPTMYFYLLAYPQLERYDLSSLTRSTVGGQTMPVAKMEEFERRVGCDLVELWGMTEIAGLGTTHQLYIGNRHGSIGVALPMVETRVASLEDVSRTVSPQEEGELMVRGPIVMKGYFGNEAATRETIEPDGWLHTGDIARTDEDGYIYIVDRRKDMIITGGYNVYPAEIERVVSAHPSVAMVAVGGVPDPVRGELARAYIVLKEGAAATEEEIIAYCRQHLAAYKVPRSVAFVEGLPRTSTGKVMRRKLREWVSEEAHSPAKPAST